MSNVSFDVAAEAYGQFMGRYSEPLAAEFVAWAGVQPGQRALDVGCGPGALTGKLVELLGASSVAAIDPSPPFVAAVRSRFPEVGVRAGVAEDLPYADGAFDCALASLVVHFMTDPVRGLAEMARVTRPGGVVAASVWDHAGGSGPLSLFWRAARDLDPEARDEAILAGARLGHLADLATTAGLREVEADQLVVTVAHPSFEEWWQPYTLGVGPAGAYVASLDPDRQDRLRAHCADLLPPAPFTIKASAWCVRARS